MMELDDATMASLQSITDLNQLSEMLTSLESEITQEIEALAKEKLLPDNSNQDAEAE